jgi:hypothetical protein
MYDEGLINRAFQLAYFICRDRTIAFGVAVEALAKLEVAAAAQDKRLYYVPAKRQQRIKVSMGELGLLQRIIYIETTPHERKQESDGTVSEEEMIIRYVKHLVKITVRRNSFYVALGIGRLLHNYSTAETGMIYDLVVQDPDRSKDDYYYRARKNKLIREILERFGQTLNMVKGPRGEIRFEIREEPSWRSELVSRCLDLFTPWGTACTIPERFDPTSDLLPKLCFAGGDPDAEHPVEANRMHAIIHPECFKRLTCALRLDEPNLRLAIPKFSVSGSDRPKRGEPLPELNKEEVSALQAELLNRSSRRLVTSGLLVVIVDDIECAKLDLARSNRVQFEVKNDAEFIEVWSRADGQDALLATHMIGHEHEENVSIVLEAGQKLSFKLSRPKSSGRETAAIAVELSYRETNPIRAAGLLWRRFAARASELKSSAMWKPALAAALVAAAAAIASYLASSRFAQLPQQVEPYPRGAKSEERRDETTAGAPKGPIQRAPLIVRRIRPPSQATRGPKPIGRTRLASIKRIYVGSLGGGSFADQARQSIIAELLRNGFAVTDNIEEAEAAIKGSAQGGASGAGRVAIKLVGPNGDTLWSTSARGQADQVARESVRRLIGRIKRPDAQDK